MKKILLLYSGGMDSTVLLHMALNQGHQVQCLGFNYGQVHKRELSMASLMCEKMEVPYQIINIELPIRAKLLDGETTYKDVSPWHVPGRNLIFVAIAASIAESSNLDQIWYGANYEDREYLFPDCYQEWVYLMNKVLAINGSTDITLEAPLLGMTKETILGLAKEYKINYNEIFSGYGQ